MVLKSAFFGPSLRDSWTWTQRVVPKIALGLLFAIFWSRPNAHDSCDSLPCKGGIVILFRVTSRTSRGPIDVIAKNKESPTANCHSGQGRKCHSGPGRQPRLVRPTPAKLKESVKTKVRKSCETAPSLPALEGRARQVVLYARGALGAASGLRFC